MALRIPSKPVAKPAAPTTKTMPLKRSTILDVFDVPMELIVLSEDNPNEQDEATFDQIVEGIKTDGFDEPIHVIPVEVGPNAGKYIITSGHHRFKAASVLGFTHIPAVIKKGWNDDKRKIELVRRNMLRGNINPEKFTQLFSELSAKGYDASVLKLQMGFTKEDAFKKLFKSVANNLPPSAKKKLEEAKEDIKSVDGLSSALNAIFKEHGTDLDHGFIVFQFGGKEHVFIECDKGLHGMVKKLTNEAREKNLSMTEIFKKLVSEVDLKKMKPSAHVIARKEARKS